MRETGRTGFKKYLKERIKGIFPSCMLFDLNPNDLQGVPDLLILNDNRWATLECKGSEKANVQPNQQYYVNLMNNMSFSSFIFPENEEIVMSKLISHLSTYVYMETSRDI